MIKLAYILKELLRNLWRNPWTALSSLLSLMLLFLLFDLFWVTAGTSEKFYRDLISQIQVEAFVAESVPDSALAPLERQIAATEGIETTAFISREEARRRLAKTLGVDPLVGYDSLNPLPRSYVLLVDPEQLTVAQMETLDSTLSLLEGIAEVAYSQSFLAKAENTSDVFAQVGLALGILIFLAALISSANGIRLMTRARAVGFRQMSLLGAGKLFIGLPFMLEGFLLSVAAAAASWGIVLYGNSRISFTELSVVLPDPSDIIWFCLVVGMVGLTSGYLGIRRLLR